MHHRQPIRLTEVTGNLCEQFVARHTGRCCEVKLVPDSLSNFFSDIHCQRNFLLIPCHVEKSLVERNRLHNVGIAVKDAMHLCRDFLIASEMWLSNHQIGAKTLCLRHGLSRVHAIFASLVTGGGHDTARSVVPNGNRTPFQVGIVELLNRRKESVHIHVYDFSLSHLQKQIYKKNCHNRNVGSGNLNGIFSRKRIMLPS